MSELHIPIPGSLWRLYNGIVYTVEKVYNLFRLDQNHPITIGYVGANGRDWSKTLAEWFRAMTAVEGSTPSVETIQDARQRASCGDRWAVILTFKDGVDTMGYGPYHSEEAADEALRTTFHRSNPSSDGVDNIEVVLIKRAPVERR